MVIMMEMTAEKIGRSIKNFENMVNQPRSLIVQCAVLAPAECSEQTLVHWGRPGPVALPLAQPIWAPGQALPAWVAVSDPVPYWHRIEPERQHHKDSVSGFLLVALADGQVELQAP